jgi:hypothetical protein
VAVNDTVEDLSDTLSDSQIIENAKGCLEYPSDFGYFGSDETLWKTSAPTITKHRDSSNLENAAFEIAWGDLCNEFPDLAPAEGEDRMEQRPGKFYVFGCSHWAVGWIEQIIVPVLKEPGEVTLANIHPAFVKALELGSEFPHLEEADSRADDMNWEDVKKDIASWQEYLADRQSDPYIKAFTADDLLQQLSEIMSESDDYRPGDEDSILYTWFYEHRGEGPEVFSVLDLHALCCWDEAHQETDGQEGLF